MPSSFPLENIWPERLPGEPALLEIAGALRAVSRLDMPTGVPRERLTVALAQAIDALQLDWALQLVIDDDEGRDCFLVLGGGELAASSSDWADDLLRGLAAAEATPLDAEEVALRRAEVLAQLDLLRAPLAAAGATLTPLGREEIVQLLSEQLPLVAGESSPTAALLAAEEWREEETSFSIAGQMTRTFYLSEFPSPVEDGWLASLLTRFQGPCRLAVYIQPLAPARSLQRLRNMQATHEAALGRQEGLVPDSRRLAALSDLKELIEALGSGRTRPYLAAVYFTLFADTLEELERRSELFEGLWERGRTRRALFRHRQGFETTLPLLYNRLQHHSTTRFLHTQGVTTLFPFAR